MGGSFTVVSGIRCFEILLTQTDCWSRVGITTFFTGQRFQDFDALHQVTSISHQHRAFADGVSMVVVVAQPSFVKSVLPTKRLREPSSVRRKSVTSFDWPGVNQPGTVQNNTALKNIP